jgi:hypothetical protein
MMGFALAYSKIKKRMAIAEAAEEKGKFEQYQEALKSEYGIDITGWEAKGIPGGKADGHKVTEYDLQQLIWGVEIEFEHSPDALIALEISMDHLQEIPDYYTRLRKMEKEAGV